MMRISGFTSMMGACLLAGAAVTASGQTTGTHRSGAVPQNSTGAGSQRERTVMDESSPNTTTTTATNGTFVANFTIKLVTPVPSGYEVLCSLSASVLEESASYTINNEVSEFASVKATVSGSTATCSVKLPYSWYLTTPSSDTADLSYSIAVTSASATNATTQESRSSSQYVPGAGAIKVPANNATTTYAIAATI